MVRFSNVVDLLASPAARAWQMILCFNPGRGELQSCDSKLKNSTTRRLVGTGVLFQESCGLGERYKSKDPPDGSVLSCRVKLCSSSYQSWGECPVRPITYRMESALQRCE
jgi:hypothetical protein